jgi:hypothetical protein
MSSTLSRSGVEFALRAATKPGELIVNIPRALSAAVTVTVQKRRRIAMVPTE